MLANLLNKMRGRYINHSKAVVISCYYNPKNSPYRLAAFNKFYDSIKHLNHRIVECAVGNVPFQLPETKYIERIRTQSNLWHKEQLLNRIVSKLPSDYEYVLWVDADVIFTNKNWMKDAVKELQTKKVVQLFEYCVHLNEGEHAASIDNIAIDIAQDIWRIEHDSEPVPRRVWRGFAKTYCDASKDIWNDSYDIRGHVGFAWGARRSVLNRVPLFEKALIGGADGIIAYASAGTLTHMTVISDMFGPILNEVFDWGKDWWNEVKGNLGYVKGNLYHIWHGPLKERQYYKRIKDFGRHIKNISRDNLRDKNGLLITNNTSAIKYMDDYFNRRESTTDNLALSMLVGYATDNAALGALAGGNLAGGMIGEMLNTNNVEHSQHNESSNHTSTSDSQNYS